MKKIKIVLKRQNVKTKEIYEKIVEFDEDIQELDLSFQNLVAIPIGLEQFKSLKTLWLNNNQITKIQFLTADGKPFNEFIISRTPAGRWGDPEDLAGTAVFLASKASDFVNGQVIYVDGGILATIGKPSNED